MPGLINAHFHSSANHLKGSFDSLPLEIFMLYESPPDSAAMDPRAVYVRTMLGAAEMLRSGVTAVLDDAFFVPAPTPALIDAVMQAYADSGLRATLALDQPNVPELDKLFGFLGRPYDERIFKQLTRPVFSGHTPGRARTTTTMSVDALNEPWRRQLSQAEIDRAHEIVASFGLDRIYGHDLLPDAGAANATFSGASNAATAAPR